ncbi:MAG: hypothetical protein EBX50_06405 [Chitinophagia bacterium]|nr:hypothetical protein [Chitinophagia bacterium]
MNTSILIDLFEKFLPSDLRLQLPDNATAEERIQFAETRKYLLEPASMQFFMLFIRPVLERQIEMRDSKTVTPFVGSCLYRKSVIEKYLDFLPEEDSLRNRYEKSGILHGEVADALYDFGII